MGHKLDFSFPVCKKGSEEKTQSRDTVLGPLRRNTQHSFSWHLMFERMSSKNYLRVTSLTSLIRSCGGGCVQPPLWQLQRYHLFPLKFYFGFIYFYCMPAFCLHVCLGTTCSTWCLWRSGEVTGFPGTVVVVSVSHLVGAGN